MELNLERAKQGLPPVDPGVTAPQIRHIVDIPPEYRQQVEQVGTNITQIALWAALGLGAFFLIRSL